MPTKEGAYSKSDMGKDKIRHDRSDMGNATSRPVGRELDEGMISDHGSGPGGGSSKLPKRA